jgi:hypothetical protein
VAAAFWAVSQPRLLPHQNIVEFAGEGQTCVCPPSLNCGNSEGMGSKVLARQLFAIEDRCSAHCKGAGQGAGNKVPRAYGGNAEGLLGTRRARNTINSILACNQAR